MMHDGQLEQLLLRMTDKRVLVVGDVMLDVYAHGAVTRLNPEEPAAPLVELHSREYRPGGAANVALNSRQLGAQVVLIGVVGQDTAGGVLREILAGQGIILENNWGKQQPRTIEKSRLVAGGRQVARWDNEEKQPERYRLDLERKQAELIEQVRRSDVVIVSDYAKGVVERGMLKIISDAARAKGILVVLDPKPKNKMNWAGLVDVITPNRKEAMELAGIEGKIDFTAESFPAEMVCRKIHERYSLQHLVVTMSEAGFLVSGRDGSYHQTPTYARKIFDVTGAGDTFVAGLACALAAGATVEEGAELANLAAGVVVEKLGTATASPEEVVRHAQWV